MGERALVQITDDGESIVLSVSRESGEERIVVGLSIAQANNLIDLLNRHIVNLTMEFEGTEQERLWTAIYKKGSPE